MGAGDKIAEVLSKKVEKGFEKYAEKKMSKVLGSDSNEAIDHFKSNSDSNETIDILKNNSNSNKGNRAENPSTFVEENVAVNNYNNSNNNPSGNNYRRNQPKYNEGNIETADDDSEEKAREAAEKRADNKSRVESIKQDIKDKIDQLKEERDSIIESIKSGQPLPALSKLLLVVFFFLTTILDSIFGSVPVVGDVGGFAILFVLWLIPCIIFLSFKPFSSIFTYLLIDFIFGITAGTFADAIPFLGGFAIDFIPEALFFTAGVLARKTFLARFYPPRAMEIAYNSDEAKNARMERTRERYGQKIKALETGMRRSVKQILANHFKTPNSGELQNMVFYGMMMIILYLSPLGRGLLTLNTSGTSMLFVGLFILITILLERATLLKMNEGIGLLLFFFLTTLINPILRSNFLATFVGKETETIVKIVFIILFVMITLNFSGKLSGKTLAVISILIILGLLTPSIIGTLQNPEKLQARRAEAAIQGKIALEQANIIDNLIAWVENQVSDGKGENINTAVQENTVEFLGIKISSMKVSRERFLENQPVTVVLDFEGKVDKPTSVRTVCKATNAKNQETLGKTTPEVFNIRNPTMGSDQQLLNPYPRVNCIFDSLPTGHYMIQSEAFYQYQGTLEIPLVLMTTTAAYNLQQRFLDLETSETLESYTGGSRVPVYSSGPIQIQPANAHDSEDKPLYITPILADYEAFTDGDLDGVYDQEVMHLTFEARKSLEDTTGEIQDITEIEFKVPAGLATKCIDINENKFLDFKPEGNLWVSTVKYSEDFLELSEDVFCTFHLVKDTKYEDSIYGESGWSEKTMYLSMTYDYKQKSLYPQPLVVV